jgi:glycolate oxidase FAD binding subunit
VLVRGGGAQLGLGFPPVGGDILLSTAALARLVEHTPGDMTATVQAGLRLADLQRALGGAGQWLALDPALPPAATVGGIVATNASGPRRLRYGGVRDQIIGVRVVRPDGTIAKGGGKVVKNVAGFDLPKLITGSLGTLGVIVAATFRLYPLPAASRTVVLTAPDPAPLCDLALRVIASTLVASAIDVAGSTDDRGCALAVRFEGSEEAVDEQARALLALAGPLAEGAETLGGPAEERLWREAAPPGPPDPEGEDGDPAPASEAAPESSPAARATPRVPSPPGSGGPGGAAPGQAVLKASLLPTGVAPWLQFLLQTAADAGLAARWRAHAGHGLVFARLSGPDAVLVGAVERLREAATAGRGSLVVADGSPALAGQLDVWGPSPALDVMRRVKAQFDPNGTLNPGRFVGRI